MRKYKEVDFATSFIQDERVFFAAFVFESGPIQYVKETILFLKKRVYEHFKREV